MKKYTILSLLFFFVFGFSHTQGSYKYVKVPSEYEFLKEENEYQLNDLTAFLFEKYGFEPIYKEKTPNGVNPCDILTAKLKEDSGWFTTKLQLQLKDCNGNVVFTSEGTSREKDYKMAYHDALRSAFTSIENQELWEATSEVEVAVAEAPEEQENSVPVKEGEKTEQEKAGKTKFLDSDKLEFQNGINSYHLEKNGSGFLVFKNEETKEFASLFKSAGGENYIYSSGNIQGNAYFDKEGNLHVEYLEPESGLLLNLVYQRKP